ncbi:hypothetical protein [Mucilaginibacter sp.]
MENLPFDTISLSGDDVQILEDTHKALRAKFNIGIDCDIHFDAKNFDLAANTETTVGEYYRSTLQAHFTWSF